MSNNFGCGAESTCKECYPFTYRCDCGIDYPEPVPFGEKIPVCEVCGLDYQAILDEIAYEDSKK